VAFASIYLTLLLLLHGCQMLANTTTRENTGYYSKLNHYGESSAKTQ